MNKIKKIKKITFCSLLAFAFWYFVVGFFVFNSENGNWSAGPAIAFLGLWLFSILSIIIFNSNL